MDEALLQETEEMRDTSTWSWQTKFWAVVLILCCGPCLCACMGMCTFDFQMWKYGLVQEMGTYLNPRGGYALLDLGGEDDIARVLQREMWLA